MTRESEFLSAVIDTAGALIVVLDRQGGIVRFNRACEQATGYTFGEVQGQLFWDLFLLPDEAGPVRQVFARLVSGQFPNRHENFWRAKDGQTRRIAWNNTVLLGQDGQVEYVIAIGIDISAQRQAELALREANTRLETRVAERTLALRATTELLERIFASVNLAIAYFDCSFNFIRVNETYAQSSGHPPAYFPGKNHFDLYPNAENEAIFRQALATGQPYYAFAKPFEYSELPARGVTYWDWTLMPVRDPDDSICGVVLMLVDVTERIQAQEALQQSHAELERRVQERTEALALANRELTDFAFIASHDLREPLRKVQAFGNRLKTLRTDEIPVQGRDYIERITAAAQRMQDMLDSLLHYARVTTHAQPFETVDLNQALAGALADLEISLEQSGGQVDAAPLPSISGDPAQLRQLFLNLVGNALKFRRPGLAPQVQVFAQPDAEGIRICIQDNGIGFDETQLTLLFQPFQRLHGQGQYEGSGMGLAICKKIVERHGGALTAHSQPGVGSTFVVTFRSEPGS